MQNLYEDEIALKKMLDDFHVRYGDKMNDWKFVIQFEDNKGSFSVITEGVYKSPIAGIRDYNTVIKSTKLNPDDISIHLVLAYNEKEAHCFNEAYLSPYLYYKKPEEVLPSPEENIKE